jgi:acylphosphatase
MDEKCCRIIVKGKVQGVFFRKYTKMVADKLGIKGFVKNEKNGSVYIEAHAEINQLKKFIQWCHYGPENAQVKKVLLEEIPLKEFESFEVIYF